MDHRKLKTFGKTAIATGLIAAVPFGVHAMTVDQHAKSMSEDQLIHDQRLDRTRQAENRGFENVQKDAAENQYLIHRDKVTAETR